MLDSNHKLFQVIAFVGMSSLLQGLSRLTGVELDSGKHTPLLGIAAAIAAGIIGYRLVERPITGAIRVSLSRATNTTISLSPASATAAGSCTTGQPIKVP
jgi:peptidoglycan/LPS O-acetylase OafA/YrhL